MQITKPLLYRMADFGGEHLPPLRDFYRINFPARAFPDGVTLAHFWHSYQKSREFYHSNLTWLALSLLPAPARVALALRFAGQALRYTKSNEFGDAVTADNVEMAKSWAINGMTAKPRTISMTVYPPFWAHSSASHAQRVAHNTFNTDCYQTHLAIESARFARETCYHAHNTKNNQQAAHTAVGLCLAEQVQWGREALEAAGLWNG